ncbi:MAG: hypothetical protein IT379_42755 [Deltaproteobacteria bacterium]|nr:hypothetical protein [Deltaproteobacteria bacterium]
MGATETRWVAMQLRGWILAIGLLSSACGDDDGATAQDDGGTRDAGGSTDGRTGGGDAVVDRDASPDAGPPVTVPERGAWRSVSTEGAPSPRVAHTIVWTGTEHIVWGGQPTEADPLPGAGPFGDGARYDPAADRWQAVSSLGAPSPRAGHKAVWTGRYMAVFGREVDVFPTQPMEGWLYEPATDTWRPMSSVGAPAPRAYYDVVAVDGRVVVWGGWSMPGVGTEAFPAATGGIYDPERDTWTALSEAGAPAYDGGHTLLAEPGGLVAYGVTAHFLAPDAGSTLAARYASSSDTWTEIGRTTGLIGNGQAYNMSALLDGQLTSISMTPDSRQCLLLELEADGTFTRTVLSETSVPSAPACPYALRLGPLVVGGDLVAPEPRLMLDVASRAIFAFPAPPYDTIASEPVSPGFLVSSWDAYEAATDGTSVFFFGGVIRASEPPPDCPEGAPCVPPGQEARGALGVLLSP